MPKKSKTLEVKLRSAIRLIWSRSKERREIIKQATLISPSVGKYFNCFICRGSFHLKMGEVDHEPPIGTLDSWQDTSKFIEKMFFGPQRVVCYECHKKKTVLQRRNKCQKNQKH